MIKRPLRNLTAASILAGATHGAIAQTPMPQTPTTKILAVGTFAPGTDMSQVQRILPTEVRETAQLYLDGKIDQWYSLEDRPGVVFILNMTDTQAAHAVLEELPLGKAHLMTFQLTPIGPLNPLRQLLVPAVPH
ncbi:MAG: muconolactone Delta-isomerase family protein [Xanthobacteraceae bacterium]|jgi:Muconolactone delta-isomerase